MSQNKLLFLCGWALLPLAALAVSGFCAVKAVELYRYSSPDFVWSKTIGTIQVSRFDRHIKTKPDQKYEKVRYTYRILYEYIVDDKLYKSNKVSIGGVDVSELAVKALAEKYPVGDTFTVYFDSNDPSFSVLEVVKGDRSAVLVFGVIAAIFAGVALLSVRWMLKRI